jgi:hypothetical protein
MKRRVVPKKTNESSREKVGSYVILGILIISVLYYLVEYLSK